MSFYSILASFSLLLIVEASPQSEHVKYYHEPHEPLTRRYLIAPEVFGDRETFAAVHFDEIYDHQSPAKLHVKVFLFDNADRVRPRECSFDREFEYEAGISSVRRLNEETVVLVLYMHEVSRGFKRATAVYVINMNTCDQKRVLELEGDVMVVPSTDGFDVIVEVPRHFCAATGYCRVSYKLESLGVSGKRPFDVDLYWRTMQVNRLNSRDLIVRGFDGNTYKIMKMDKLSGQTTQIMSMDDPGTDVVSSGLSACWRSRNFNTRVHCVRYGDNGKKILSRAIDFDGPVTLIDVHAVGEGEILIITKRNECGDEGDCWLMWATRVSKDLRDPKHVFLRFPCTGDDQKKLAVVDVDYDEEEKKVDLLYVCKNGFGYTFSSFSVD